MEIVIQEAPSATVVILCGSVDGLTANDVNDALAAQLAKGNKRLVADCSRLAYISSAGLRTLLVTLKQARIDGGDLRLAAVQSNVLKVLELAGFTGILKLYGDTPAAVSSYSN